jgi:hypothetical protein
VCACADARHGTAQTHRELLLDAFDANDLRRLWLLVRLTHACRHAPRAAFQHARLLTRAPPTRAAQAGRRYSASEAELAGVLGYASSVLDMLPLSDHSSERAPQRREWHVYALRAPELPRAARAARALLFPTAGAGAGALGGRVAAGRRDGVRTALANRFSPLYFSLEPCDAVPATRERCDAVMDWGARGATPPLLPEEVPFSPGGLATARALGISLPPVRAPRWPGAGLRAYLRPVGPGVIVGAAYRGDGVEAAATRADAEADEAAFTFLMLRADEATPIRDEAVAAEAARELERERARVAKLNDNISM